ncbi:MAG: Zn-ribbon domain-containing OB-fold protein [Thaumarchaeota archaeon]|nr:Zn-ribbon domain-containing OB-fold protein [Nitrososphaerota archaeon]
MSIAYWRERNRYYRILGSKCKECSAEFFPPVYKCRKCNSEKLAEQEMPKEGKVMAYTLSRDIITGFEDQEPMIIGLIELQNGVKMVAQIADASADQLAVGDKVKAVFRRVSVNGEAGQIFYGYKFVKIDK